MQAQGINRDLNWQMQQRFRSKEDLWYYMGGMLVSLHSLLLTPFFPSVATLAAKIDLLLPDLPPGDPPRRQGSAAQTRGQAAQGTQLARAEHQAHLGAGYLAARLPQVHAE